MYSWRFLHSPWNIQMLSWLNVEGPQPRFTDQHHLANMQKKFNIQKLATYSVPCTNTGFTLQQFMFLLLSSFAGTDWSCTVICSCELWCIFLPLIHIATNDIYAGVLKQNDFKKKQLHYVLEPQLWLNNIASMVAAGHCSSHRCIWIDTILPTTSKKPLNWQSGHLYTIGTVDCSILTVLQQTGLSCLQQR